MAGGDGGAGDAGEQPPSFDELLPFETYLQWRGILADVDANDDGKVSVAEVLRREDDFRAVLPGLILKTVSGTENANKCAPDIVAVFRRLDRDRDGYMTIAELLVGTGVLPDDAALRGAVADGVRRYDARRREMIDAGEISPRAGAALPDAAAAGAGAAPGEGAPRDFLAREDYFAYRSIFAVLNTDGSDDGGVSLRDLSRAAGAQARAWVAEQLKPIFGAAAVERIALLAAPDSSPGASPATHPIARRTSQADFKAVDRDRSGQVSSEELLRHLLPEVQPHALRARVRPWAREWEAANPGQGARQRREWAAAHPAEEASPAPAPAGPAEGRPAAPLVDVDSYVFYKEVFEQMDLSSDGRVSIQELQRWIQGNAGAFGRTLDWKAVDRDRSGYVTFDELLRAAYPSAPSFRLRKECAVLAAAHGAPRGAWAATPAEPARPGTAPRDAEQLLQQLSGSAAAGRVPTPGTRYTRYDARIRELEERVREVEREGQERDRRARARRGGRRALSPDQQQALNARLTVLSYTRPPPAALPPVVWRSRDEDGRMVRPSTSHRMTRGWGDERLDGEELDSTNSRLYDEPLAARTTRREEIEEKRAEARTEMLSVHRTPVDKEAGEALVDRLGVSDIFGRQEKREMLVRKYQSGAQSAGRWRRGPLSAADAAAAALRMCDASVARKAQARERLREKYDTSPPRRQLSAEQQASLVDRIGPKG